MLKLINYKPLPAGTPRWLTRCILLLGGALGISISAFGLVALYGISAFLINLFFPNSSFSIDAHEAMYLGVVGVSSTLTATLISYLAVYMNGLSRRAIKLSGIVWAPALVTVILVLLDTSFASFIYPFSTVWVAGVIVGFVFGCILPWVLLRTKAARTVHSRP